ncbi:MAG TPA: DUF2232 domain-containing protein [Gemmatimonadales bacterium]|nr:DUF2232 domain-containing protein [Gemmatimonadales bacterium]
MGAVLGLGLFLSVAPWGFFAPLTVLLLFGRPRTAREWLWIGAGVIWTASLWMQEDGTLLFYAVNAWGALLAGVFGIVALSPRPWRTSPAWIATAAAAVMFLLLLHANGFDLGAIQFEATRALAQAQADMRVVAQSLLGRAPATDPAAPAAVGAITPALFTILGTLGLDLAWRWYRRIAAAPAGAPPRPFAEFRFSDHLVWILVVALATTLAGSAGYLPASAGPTNALLLMGVLYAIRGLAIVWPAIHRMPVVTRIALLFVSVLLFVFVMAGLFGIGLADTWVDFRRRKPAAQGG